MSGFEVHFWSMVRSELKMTAHNNMYKVGQKIEEHPKFFPISSQGIFWGAIGAQKRLVYGVGRVIKQYPSPWRLWGRQEKLSPKKTFF